jgi:hypothetical protein
MAFISASIYKRQVLFLEFPFLGEMDDQKEDSDELILFVS